jgi:hypothetical protein
MFSFSGFLCPKRWTLPNYIQCSILSSCPKKSRSFSSKLAYGASLKPVNTRLYFIDLHFMSNNDYFSSCLSFLKVLISVSIFENVALMAMFSLFTFIISVSFSLHASFVSSNRLLIPWVCSLFCTYCRYSLSYRLNCFHIS